MKQLAAAVITLTMVVAGIVVATSLSSAAQEEDGVGDTTTTTVAGESEFLGRFGLRFGDSLPPDLAELESCLIEQGIEADDLDRGFMFEFRGEAIEGLAEALEACGLPSFGQRFPLGDQLPERFHFGGDLPDLAEFESCLTEQGIEIPDDVDHRFMFELRGEDIEGLAEALEACGLPGFTGGFDFGDMFPDGFPFDGELPDGFGFGDEGFHLGGPALDLDELASCLADLGSFDSVDQVRRQLEECLPDPTLFGEPGGVDRHHGRGGPGSPFDGHGPFGFDLDDDAPELEGTST